MGMQVALRLPEEDKVYGVWLSTDGEHKHDVYMNMSKSFGWVLGYNGDQMYRSKPADQFSDLALMIDPNGKLTFQYADEHGKVQLEPVSKKVFEKLFLRFLRDLKEEVK